VGLLTACRADPERALTVYAGPYTDNSLPEEIALLQPLTFEDADLVAGAYSQSFAHPSPRQQWEWEVNVASWTGNQDHFEVNGLVMWRWKAFPWNDTVRTTFGFGNGLSYANSAPDLEAFFHPETGTNHLLWHIATELTFGAPRWEAWDVVLRVHHRSGVFGTFDGVDGGSNVVALGLRYWF
jgi:hypothetical protein